MLDSDGCFVFPAVRSALNYDGDAVSRETWLVSDVESRTQQQFKEECDINVILDRFGMTGQLPVPTVQPMEGDFTEIGDYQSALEAVRRANENFMTLPSKVRERFEQDPRKFVDFCINPANIEAVRALGLAPAMPAVPAKKVQDGESGQ